MHTPGPWKQDGYAVLAQAGKGYMRVILEPPDEKPEIPSDEKLANSLLAAEAPAMLEALKLMVGWLEREGGWSEALDEKGIYGILARIGNRP